MIQKALFIGLIFTFSLYSLNAESDFQKQKTAIIEQLKNNPDIKYDEETNSIIFLKNSTIGSIILPGTIAISLVAASIFSLVMGISSIILSLKKSDKLMFWLLSAAWLGVGGLLALPSKYFLTNLFNRLGCKMNDVPHIIVGDKEISFADNDGVIFETIKWEDIKNIDLIKEISLIGNLSYKKLQLNLFDTKKQIITKQFLPYSLDTFCSVMEHYLKTKNCDCPIQEYSYQEPTVHEILETAKRVN